MTGSGQKRYELLRPPAAKSTTDHKGKFVPVSGLMHRPIRSPRPRERAALVGLPIRVVVVAPGPMKMAITRRGYELLMV
jgi:hypothetical protein